MLYPDIYAPDMKSSLPDGTEEAGFHENVSVFYSVRDLQDNHEIADPPQNFP